MQDRPLFGIALMLGFCALIPFADASAKLLSGMPLAELAAIRFGAQAAILIPVVRAGGGSLRFGRRLFGRVLLRSALHVAGLAMMYMALRALPLADAVAIAFVLPFLMLLTGAVFLGEAVGPHRLMACAAGFAGTLMVIQPNFATVGPAALLPLGVAVVFASFMLITRQIAKEIDPVALQAVSGLWAMAIITPALVAGAWLDLPELGLRLPASAREIGLIVLMGGVGTVAHLMMTVSLRYAPSATLAPIQYMELPVVTLVGWMIFGTFPNPLAASGIALTIAAGLYVLHRERVISASGRRQPRQGPTSAG